MAISSYLLAYSIGVYKNSLRSLFDNQYIRLYLYFIGLTINTAKSPSLWINYPNVTVSLQINSINSPVSLEF